MLGLIFLRYADVKFAEAEKQWLGSAVDSALIARLVKQVSGFEFDEAAQAL